MPYILEKKSFHKFHLSSLSGGSTKSKNFSSKWGLNYLEGTFLGRYGVWAMENGNESRLSQRPNVNFLSEISISRSKTDDAKRDVFSFLN